MFEIARGLKAAGTFCGEALKAALAIQDYQTADKAEKALRAIMQAAERVREIDPGLKGENDG